MKKPNFILYIAILTVSLCFSFVTQAASVQAESFNTAKLKGHGIIEFQGNGKITINGEGVIFIGENGMVNLVGLASFFENEEDGNRVYIVPEEGGTVEIEGEDMEVSFYGADFGYIVTATAKSKLNAKGYGYYRIGLTMGVWTADGAEFNLGN